jgi:hypothetical protein
VTLPKLAMKLSVTSSIIASFSNRNFQCLLHNNNNRPSLLLSWPWSLLAVLLVTYLQPYYGTLMLFLIWQQANVMGCKLAAELMHGHVLQTVYQCDTLSPWCKSFQVIRNVWILSYLLSVMSWIFQHAFF